MRLGRFVIDPQRLVIEIDGVALDLAPKSVEFLAVLVERAGDVVSKRELLDRLWPDSAVEEANLTQHAYVVRKALRVRDPLLGAAIVTVPKRGYRFVAPASPLATPSTSVAGSHWFARIAVFVAFAMGLGAVTRAEVWRHASTPATPLGERGAQMARLGRYYLDLRTATGMLRSRGYFARVILSDPRNPTGYAGLADALALTANYRFGSSPRRVYLQEASSLAMRAVRLDPASAEAHASLGAVALFRNDHRAAERELREAIALDPEYAPAHHWLGTSRFDDGDFAGSARELEVALRMNPVSTASSAWLEMACYLQRRYETAIDYGRRAIELDPARYDTLREVGLAYAATGRYAAALATFRRIPRASETYSSVPFLIASVYAREGRVDLARRIVVRERRRNVVDPEMTFALLALGQRNDAARAAEHAHFSDCRDHLIFIGDPRFDAVRTDAAFSNLFAGRCGGHA